jgi:hypothetical protein
LPIVRAYVEKLGLVELLNDQVESKMDVEAGLMFLAMILDTLSGRSPLYRLEAFFESQDTELLLGKSIDAKRFNDDNVGRFLDKLYDAGTISDINVQFRRYGPGGTPGYAVDWMYSGVIQENQITGTFSGGGDPNDGYTEGCSTTGTFTVTVR